MLTSADGTEKSAAMLGIAVVRTVPSRNSIKNVAATSRARRGLHWSAARRKPARARSCGTSAAPGSALGGRPGRGPDSSTAMAALCPPMALTAPPRRAPEPQSRICGSSVATPQRCAGVSRGCVVLDEGPVEAAVEDVAPRHADRPFDVQGGLGFDAGLSVRAGQQQFLDGFGQDRVQRLQDGGLQFRPALSLFSAVISRSGTCRPNTVRVCAPAACSSGDRMVGSVREWQ